MKSILKNSLIIIILFQLGCSSGQIPISMEKVNGPVSKDKYNSLVKDYNESMYHNIKCAEGYENCVKDLMKARDIIKERQKEDRKQRAKDIVLSILGGLATGIVIGVLVGHGAGK